MEPSTPLVAVVLAGGDRDDRLAATVGAASKALVPLRDVPMGAYVAHALRRSGVVDHIIWVGETDGLIRRLVDVELPGGQRMVDSLSLGLGAALGWAIGVGRRQRAPGDAGSGPEPRLLVVSADLPWWDAEGVEAFVTHAPAVDLVYPVVREADALARFPDQPRTYARLRDGRFTGGNALLLSTKAVTRLLPLVDAAFHARKRPWALAQLVGFRTLLALLTGTARISAIEARVEKLLGMTARAFITSDATIAADVDDPAHLPATLGLPQFPSLGDA
ncbi:MAG: NTP transferase domain-containing protein [Trueperaceae bacterium]|nr:NTP transferase domain-containing protein [Trueperaceae bacterium]